jgi:hypothetical protein
MLDIFDEDREFVDAWWSRFADGIVYVHELVQMCEAQQLLGWVLEPKRGPTTQRAKQTRLGARCRLVYCARVGRSRTRFDGQGGRSASLNQSRSNLMSPGSGTTAPCCCRRRSALRPRGTCAARRARCSRRRVGPCRAERSVRTIPRRAR